MYYILISTTDNRTLFQELQNNTIVRICDLDGNTVHDFNESHWVLDANPPQPSWARPDQPTPPVHTSSMITKSDFRHRFTMQEKIAIYTAAETNVAVKVWLDDLMSTEMLDVYSANVRLGLNYLVQLSLIAADRVEEIINA